MTRATPSKTEAPSPGLPVPEPGPRRSSLWLGALVVGALLTYGSLYPFEFTYPPPRGAFGHFAAFREADLHLGDMLANVLLFLPLGFLLASLARSWGRGIALAVVVGVVFGVGLQLAQVLLPARLPSLWDAGLNTLGSALGALAGPGSALRLLDRLLPQPTRIAFVPVALIALWLAVETFPFVPALDWQGLKDSLKPLLLYPSVRPVAVLENATGWAALAWLWRARAGLPWPRLGPLLILAGTLAAQVLIVQRAPSVSGLIGGGAGFALGSMRLPPRTHCALLATLLVTYLGVSGLLPLSLRDAPRDFTWVPFAGFLEGAMLHGMHVGLEKLFWYALLLELLMGLGMRLRWAVAVGVLLIGGIEYVQRWTVAGHVAEITDPLILVLLGFGYGVLRRPPPGSPAGSSASPSIGERP